jgi:hypothetical protein
MLSETRNVLVITIADLGLASPVHTFVIIMEYHHRAPRNNKKFNLPDEVLSQERFEKLYI